MGLKVLLRAALVVCLAAVALRAAQGPPDDVTFRIIVVSSADAAQRIGERITGGANVVALAQAESIDPSASAGGLIGPISLSSLRPELRDALQQLDVGQVSPVVRVPLGFAVIQRIQPPASPGLRLGEFPALSSIGAIRATLSVDGFSEAETALANFAKPEDWNQDPRGICQVRQQSIAETTQALNRVLSPGSALFRSVEPLEIVEAHIAFGNLYVYDGKMREAIDQFERALRVAEAQFPEMGPQLLQMLGIAHLHQSEIENGILHKPGARCLLSTRPSVPLAITTDSDRAVQYFRRYLDAQPDDLEVKWLLNMTHMITGGHPDRVPSQFLIPSSAFESEEDVGRFVDVAPALGLDTVASAGGVIVDDFDNDGRLDIVSSNSNNCGPMHLFRRAGDGSFGDQASKAFEGQLGGLNLVQTDYNNDGCRDVYVLRGGWVEPQRNSLLRNNCDGTFTDVTQASGLAAPATSTQTAVWADIDNDGFLDLFVGNEDQPAQLFRNKGNGTFEDVAEAAGVNRTAFTKGVNAADYDNDGFVDFYVSNLGGGNFLYRNNGKGQFSEISSSAGIANSDRSFPVWFFDYDNDGFEDLFVTSYYQSVEESAKTYLRLPHNANGMKLYRNLGDGSFRNVSREMGLDKVYMPMGVNFGDIDNDGFLDMYLGTGSPSYGALVPSVLLRNREGKSFVDVTMSSGTGELHKGHGVAFADLDNDGDQEIVFQVGGATPGDAHAFRLFENPGHGNDWLGLHLVGVKTNRAAIGARIKVTVADERGVRRSMHRTVNSGGSFGASPLQQHVGLGKASKVVEVEVFWPVSRTRQRFTNVAKNQVIEIRELADSFVTLSRPPLPLRGRAGSAAPR